MCVRHPVVSDKEDASSELYMYIYGYIYIYICIYIYI